jgi:hypothetical protein
MYCEDGVPVVSNCIFWGNVPDQLYGDGMVVTCSDIQGGWDGVGNLDRDPVFADVANSDCHLKSQAGRWDPISRSWITDNVTSPCIDTGDPDCDGSDEPEPNGSRVNMGAYGGSAEASKSP